MSQILVDLLCYFKRLRLSLSGGRRSWQWLNRQKHDIFGVDHSDGFVDNLFEE